MGEESIRIDGVGNLMPAVQSLVEKRKAGARVMLSCIETITAKYIRIQDDPIWERIDGYIDEHIHDRITVENISAEIFISPSTIYHRTDQAKHRDVPEQLCSPPKNDQGQRGFSDAFALEPEPWPEDSFFTLGGAAEPQAAEPNSRSQFAQGKKEKMLFFVPPLVRELSVTRLF